MLALALSLVPSNRALLSAVDEGLLRLRQLSTGSSEWWLLHALP
jgi:hypothetical protein